MSSIDMAALASMAEGDGSEKVLLTKRALRTIIAELKAREAAAQATAAFERIVGARL